MDKAAVSCSGSLPTEPRQWTSSSRDTLQRIVYRVETEYRVGTEGFGARYVSSEEDRAVRLKGKVVVITGATQGIGQGCAVRMAAEGASVVCADIQENDQTARRIVENGGRAVHVAMDVRDSADWDRTVGIANERFGAIDLLGNVAGVVNTLSEDTVVGLTEDGWQFVIDTDLKGTWLGMRAVIPGMIENGGGRIVNISSLAALVGLPNLAAYSAAKGGVIGLTQQAALEYAPKNILVNAICPGTIDTPILGDITEQMRKENSQAHMVKRLGKPADIAGTMCHFFSDDGAFLTGLTYPVDGGWSVNGRCY